MKLLTQKHYDQMLANGVESQETPGAVDHRPVVKLFTPDANATWLLSELDPDNPDWAWGLCDLGLGFPELGTVSMSELGTVRGALGLPVERDLHFTPDKTLSGYAEEALLLQRISA